MARELVRRVVDHVDRHRARRRVDGPPLEAGHAAVAERSEEVLGEHHVVDAQVDHDRAVVGVVRVERVERVADRGVDPHDVGDSALAGQQPDPVAVVGVPPEREAAGECQVEVDGARLVVDDRVALRQRHVVEHRHARQRDVDRAAHLAVVADDDVLHVVEPLGPGVDHRVHLARVGIDLRVGGERAGQGAVEVVASDGLELVGRARPGTHRPRPSPTSCRRTRRRWCWVRPRCRSSCVRGCRADRGTRTRSSNPTYRLRYHSALPSSSRMPCTMPSPMNQWCDVWSGGVIGFGPLRR